MQPLHLIADLELEKSIISKILHYTFSGNIGTLSEDDNATLFLAINSLSKDNGSFFSLTIHEDIFNYICKQSLNGKYPNPWELTRYLQQHSRYRNQQNTVQQQIKQLIDSVEACAFSLESAPLMVLVNNLIDVWKIKAINSKLINGVASKDDIEDIKTLLSDVGESTSSRDKIEKRLTEFRSTSDPIVKIESKKAMRMMGFSPQEVAEVTDNYTPPRPTPKIVSALDFLNKKFSDATWIYPGLIKAGVVNLITGQGGSGKTMFCYDAMLSFLANKPFIGESPSVLVNNPNNRGLIINADQPAVDAQEMLKSNPLAWKLAREEKFNILESDWCLADILHLELLLKDNVFNFIVIDSYKAIHSHLYGWDENHPSASMGIKELQRLCSVYGCTMLLVHHAGTTEAKGRHKSRGHSSIPDTASSVLSISASIIDKDKGDPNIRFLDISKTRNAERTSLTLKFNPLSYSYELLPDTKGQDRGKINRLADALMIDFRNTYPFAMSNDALLKKVVGFGDRKTTLARVLQKLEQRGFIEKQIDEISNEFMYKMVDALHKPSKIVDNLAASLDVFDDF